MNTKRLENMKRRTHEFIDKVFESTENLFDDIDKKGKSSKEKSAAYLQKLRDEGQELKKEMTEAIDELKGKMPRPSEYATKKELGLLKKRIADLEKRIAADEVELHGEQDY